MIFRKRYGFDEKLPKDFLVWDYIIRESSTLSTAEILKDGGDATRQFMATELAKRTLKETWK